MAALARYAFYWLRLISQLCPFLGRKNLVTAVHILITSSLVYCNTIYREIPLKSVQKLQLVEKAATRMLIEVVL